MKDELDFLDKAMLAAMAGLLADPNLSSGIATMARNNAEALLDERRKAHERFRGATKGEPTSKTVFPDELVERLAKAVTSDWESCPEYEQDRARNRVRAILSELAKMPCELPTSEPLAQVLNSCDGAGQSTNFAKSMWLAQWLRINLGPILTTHKASLAHYRKSFEVKQARVVELESAANESAQQYAQTLARIAELESRTRIESDGRRVCDGDGNAFSLLVAAIASIDAELAKVTSTP